MLNEDTYPSQPLLSPIAQSALWRRCASQALRNWQQNLQDESLLTPTVAEDLTQALKLLNKSRYTVAVVSEVSRGKSELINALLFSQYGKRILPVGAGLTTFCPTEFFYDANITPYLEVLPMATRALPITLTELFDNTGDWKRYPLPVDDVDALLVTLKALRATQHVSLEDAQRLGLLRLDEGVDAHDKYPTGTLEIPLWRHARVNFPHPLLESGLSIVDTPGLNVLEVASELTYAVLPTVDATLFLLAADSGVTYSEHANWQQYIRHFPVHSPASNTLLVLNKKDLLLDPLRNQVEVSAMLEEQLARCAHTLNIPIAQTFAVSAQQALFARIAQDSNVVESSGVPALEASLNRYVIEQSQPHTKDYVVQTLASSYSTVSQVLSEKMATLRVQLDELTALGGVKDRAKAIKMYASDTEKRYTVEVALRLNLQQILDTHANKLFDIAAAHTMNQGFNAALHSCQQANANNIKQHLKAAITIMQMRCIALQGELKSNHHSALQGLERIDKLSAETSGQPSKHTPASLIAALPTVLDLTPVIDELNALMQQSSANLPSIPLLTTAQHSSAYHIVNTIMERCTQMGVKLRGQIGPWLGELRIPIEEALLAHQTALRKRRETLSRIESAQYELKESIQFLNDNLLLVEQQSAKLEAIRAEVLAILSENSNNLYLHRSEGSDNFDDSENTHVQAAPINLEGSVSMPVVTALDAG